MLHTFPDTYCCKTVSYYFIKPFFIVVFLVLLSNFEPPVLCYSTSQMYVLTFHHVISHLLPQLAFSRCPKFSQLFPTFIFIRHSFFHFHYNSLMLFIVIASKILHAISAPNTVYISPPLDFPFPFSKIFVKTSSIKESNSADGWHIATLSRSSINNIQLVGVEFICIAHIHYSDICLGTCAWV